MTNTPTTVAELLKDPDNWTKGAYSRDSDGNDIGGNVSGGTCWCLIGAIYKIYDSSSPDAENKLQAAINELYNGDDIVSFNDKVHRTHSEIMEVVKLADV